MSTLPEALAVRHRGQALRLGLRLATRRSPRQLYTLVAQLFDTLTDGSRIFALGVAEPGTPAAQIDLVAGQRALIEEIHACLPEVGRWLDVGSGLGGPALMAVAARPGITLTGLDITPGEVAAAQELAASQGLAQRARFVEGDMAAMPFEDASFGALCAIESAFHCHQRPLFFSEASRVLEPGGRFVVADFAAASPPLGGLDRRLLQLGLFAAATPTLWSFERWAEAATAAGFVDIEQHDLTDRVRPAIAGWAARMAERREELAVAYPRLFLDTFRRGIEAMLDRDQLPFRYLLMTGGTRG